MALSLIDLLDLPPNERTAANIILNIPSLKRRCDLFYNLADKEAFQLLKNSEIFRSSSDLAINETQTSLCVLMKGKVSLCHKTIMSPTPKQLTEQQPKPNETDNIDNDKKDRKTSRKNSQKKIDKDSNSNTEGKSAAVAPASTREVRRFAVMEMVTSLLEFRKSMQAEEKRYSAQTNSKDKSDETPGPPNIIRQEIIPRATLYGRPIVQYLEGAYFGGPCMMHHQTMGKNDQYTYVCDTAITLLTIPLELQSTIVNYHYLNTIKDKELTLSEHRVTKRLTKSGKLSLLHEMVEEHYVHGNVLTTKGKPSDVVYLVKSGFARIYMDVMMPKEALPEAVQHLPSTRLRQKLKTFKFDIMDVGPGELIGGLEQLCEQTNYMFTVVATCETILYNIPAGNFKDIVLKPNSKPLQFLTNDLKNKWAMRRQLADVSLCPETDKIICKFLGEEKYEDNSVEAHLEDYNSELLMKKRSVPAYMVVNANPRDSDRPSFRPPNRGPFADRVRNRMKELGFKSRRGT